VRQGQIFGFAVEGVDFKGGWIHVNRQVRLVGTKPVFALHALRHAYASVLLEAGESIKALSEYLGHSDPGDPPGTQGTSVPPAKPMCPQCALAA
jgi:integrase